MVRKYSTKSAAIRRALTLKGINAPVDTVIDAANKFCLHPMDKAAKMNRTAVSTQRAVMRKGRNGKGKAVKLSNKPLPLTIAHLVKARKALGGNIPVIQQIAKQCKSIKTFVSFLEFIK